MNSSCKTLVFDSICTQSIAANVFQMKLIRDEKKIEHDQIAKVIKDLLEINVFSVSFQISDILELRFIS